MTRSRTVVLIKPDGCADPVIREMVDACVAASGLEIVRRYRVLLTDEDVLDIWPRFAQPKYALTSILLRVYLTSGDSEVLVLAGEQAIERGRQIRAAVRARFGDCAVANGVHAAADEAEASWNVRKLLPSGEFRRPQIIDDAAGLWGRLARVPVDELEATVRGWWRRKAEDGWDAVWSRIPGGPYATTLLPGDPHSIDFGISALCELMPYRPAGRHFITYIEAEIRRGAVIATGDRDAMRELTARLLALGLHADVTLTPR